MSQIVSLSTIAIGHLASHPLSDYLSGLRGEEIIFAPNPGNCGDAMIACSTYRLFDRLGIRYVTMQPDCSEDRTKGRTLLYGGGGNLVDFYSNAREFIGRHHRSVRKLIILPHTILGHADLLGSFGGNVTIICREQASYSFVRKHAPHAEVLQMDDMAFCLDTDDLLRQGAKAYWPAVSLPGFFLRNTKRIVRMLTHMAGNMQHPSILNAFRNDVEKTDIVIPPDNIDVSHVFAPDDMSCRKAEEATYRMLTFLRRFETIRTNRLHVCIASLLLGKKVFFFQNSYGKNGFVYEYSMKGRYPLLTWHEGELNKSAMSQ